MNTFMIFITGAMFGGIVTLMILALIGINDRDGGDDW